MVVVHASGSAPHLAVELFSARAGIKLTHVPYKGGAPALTALMGGEVDLMFDTFSTTLPHVKSGRIRPLAATSARRSATFPDIPTVAESGLPGYEAGNWFALFAPAGTPAPVVDRLAKVLAQANASAVFRDRLTAQGAEPMRGTPEELATLIRTESAPLRSTDPRRRHTRRLTAKVTLNRFSAPPCCTPHLKGTPCPMLPLSGAGGRLRPPLRRCCSHSRRLLWHKATRPSRSGSSWASLQVATSISPRGRSVRR